MIKEEVKILNKLGIHARPANKMVKIASQAKSDIMLKLRGNRANAKSILGVIVLQAEKGSILTIEVNGEDEKEVMKQLKDLINSKFGEE